MLNKTVMLSKIVTLSKTIMVSNIVILKQRGHSERSEESKSLS